MSQPRLPMDGGPASPPRSSTDPREVRRRSRSTVHLFPNWWYGVSHLDVPYPQQPRCMQKFPMRPMILRMTQEPTAASCKRCLKLWSRELNRFENEPWQAVHLLDPVADRLYCQRKDMTVDRLIRTPAVTTHLDKATCRKCIKALNKQGLTTQTEKENKQ